MATAMKETSKPTTAGARPQSKPFPMNSLSLAETKGLRWRLDAPAGVTPAEIEDAARWAVIGSRLNSFDIVELVGHAGLWWAEAIIVQAERGSSISVKVLRVVDLPPQLEREQRAVPAGYEIRFDIDTRTYGAFRLKDGVPLTSGHAQWADCYAALVSHATLRQS